MARFEHVSGHTGCLYLRGNCIPVYRLSESEWILIDSGSRYDREELLHYLEEHGIRVNAVLTSHAHYDHVGNHRALKIQYGCECIMTAFDGGAVRDTVSLKACFYSCTESEIRRGFSDMVCRADRILGGGEEEVVVSGARFKVLDLPGHAASQVGFVTPDNVTYLGDCLLGIPEVNREKIVYMLDWIRALDTMKAAEGYDGTPCILSHYGVYTDIKTVSAANVRAFEKVLGSMRKILTPEFFLEEMVKQAVSHFDIPVRSFPKARLMERMVRSLLEYMAEAGELNLDIKDGIIVYTRHEYV